MSLVLINRALEKHLSAMTPSIPTAYPNVAFNAPDTLYQSVQIIPRNPVDPTLGKGYYREHVQLQIVVVGQFGTGSYEVLNHAEIIRARFQKGTFLQEGSVRIHVFDTPSIKGLMGSERVMCPVLIDVYAEVLT